MRYVAIDLGDARTGLAVGDAITRIVSPLSVVECPTGLCSGQALLDLLVKAIDDTVFSTATPDGHPCRRPLPRVPP